MIKAVTRRKDAANPAYQSRLHLRQAPFGPGADPAFFYADPVRERYLNMLLHLTQYSEELLLVTGESGMGKTALLEKYLSRADDHWQICRLAGDAAAQADALFQHVAQCFKLDLGQVSPDRLLDALTDHLARLQQQMTPVLAIDDAHRLSDDALEIALRLAELQGEHGRLIRVVLFADPTLLSRLAGDRFHGIPEPHRLGLEALDEEQTGAYLNHRLRAAGYSGTTPFTAKHIKRIHKDTRGVPAAINREAHQVLAELGGGGASGPCLAVPAAVWKTAAGGLALGLLVMAAHDELASPLEGAPFAPPTPAAHGEPGSGPITRQALAPAPAQGGLAMVLRQGERLLVSCGSAVAAEPLPGEMPPAQGRPEPEPPEPLSRPLMQRLPEPVPPPAEDAAAEESMGAVEPLPESPQVAEPPPALPAEPAAEMAEPPLVPDSVPQPAPVIGAVAPNPIVGSRTPQTLTLRGDNLTPIGSVALSWSDGAKVLDPSQVTAVTPDQIELRFTTGVKADSWAVQVTAPDGTRSNILHFAVVAPAAAPALHAPSKAPSPRPAEAPQAVVKTADALQDATWVRSRAAGNFTIQLVAAAHLETLTKFMQRHPLPATTAAVGVLRNGSAYHLLLLGDFASRDEADKVLATLPKAIRDTRPWVRAFAGVQTELTRDALPSPEPSAAPMAAAEPRDAAWLWSQPPTHFTVQLATVHDRAALAPLLAGVPADVPVSIATHARDGQRTFTLLYGSYPGKASATAAIGQLPARMRSGSPWVRPFADIQDGLSLNRP